MQKDKTIALNDAKLFPSEGIKITRCKDCKNRGIVNTCPFSGYVTVAKKTDSRGTDTSPLPYDYGETQIQTYCNARDNDFCSRGERRRE